MAYSPDGTHVISGGADNMLKLWDATTGKMIRTLKHPTHVLAVAYSPDGKRILSGDGGGTLRLWDAGTGQAQRTLEAHSSAINSVAFSHDGTRVLSGAFDGLQTVGCSHRSADPHIRRTPGRRQIGRHIAQWLARLSVSDDLIAVGLGRGNWRGTGPPYGRT